MLFITVSIFILLLLIGITNHVLFHVLYRNCVIAIIIRLVFGFSSNNTIILTYIEAVICFCSHFINVITLSLICTNPILIECCPSVSEVAICYVSGDPHLPHVRRSNVALPGRVPLQLGQFPAALPRPTLFPGVGQERASLWYHARVVHALRRRRSVRTHRETGQRQEGLRKWPFSTRCGVSHYFPPNATDREIPHPPRL